MTSKTWIVAAEGSQELISGAMRPGVRNGQPLGEIVPKGKCHAVIAGQQRTACRVTVDGLQTFDLPFLERNFLERCDLCLDAIAADANG